MKRRKDGRWVKVVNYNGKSISFYSRAENEKKAKRDILRQMVEYTEKEERGKTLLEVSEEWYNIHTRNLAYSTSVRYNRYMEQLNDYLKGEYIKAVTSNDIEKIMADMVRKQYSSKTIQDFLSVVRLIFRYAHKMQYISDDITFYLTPQKGKAPVHREPINEDETIAVSEMLSCTFGLLAFFYLCTGLRKGEVLALQWKDIDFENKRINIYKTVYFVSNAPHIKNTTKTKAGTRYMILLDCLAEVLLPIKGNPNDYVFNKNGKLIDKSYYTRQWNKYKEESGINTTAHPLRHTYSTLVFEAGISEKDAQMLMGHSSIVVTHNIYTHIRAKHMEKTATQLNNYMASALTKAKGEE